MDAVRPRLTLLSEQHVAQVDEASLRLLANVGVRVDDGWARDLFLRQGARPGGNGRVFLPPDLVRWALRVAPEAVDVYDRRGDLAFRLGHGTSPSAPRFGLGVACLYYQDPQTDEVSPFTRRHMALLARLGGALDSFDVISTLGVVQDVDPAIADLYATLEMVANTTKPLILLVAAEPLFARVLDLLRHLCGDLQARPFVIPYLNPITPLVIDAGTTAKMRHAIEWGLPFIYSSYGMAGASTPITPAGMLVLLNADLLAGLTLSQLIAEGSRVILGFLPAYFDMRGAGSFYDAHSYLLNLACAEMMAHYGLPHAGTSGSGIGWGPDPIAWAHQWMNHLTSCLGPVGLVPFVGDTLGSKVFTPVLAVYADEVIVQARRLAEGLSLAELAESLAEVEQLGPGGSYLISPLTLRFFRQAYFRSRVFPNLSLEQWQERGCPQAIGLLRAHTVQRLTEAAAPPDQAELLAHGEAYVARIATAG